MDRQLVVKPFEGRFHVCFHNYMGPFEGRQIAKWLGLAEVEAPEDARRWRELKTGEYFLWHAMDRHPDLHTILPGDKLKDVARAMDHFHVRAVEGGDLIPELAPEEREPHNEENYIEAIERSHASVWTKGPMAVFQAFLVRAIPAALVLLVLLVAARHFGDHREAVGLDEVFRRAALPAAEQSWFAGLVAPDHSREVRTSISAVRFMEGERVILRDGQLLRFAGIGNVRPMLEAARDHYTLPQIEITLRDGQARIERIVVGPDEFGHGAQLIREARLPLSAEEPARASQAGNAPWWFRRELPASDAAAMRAVVGERLSVEGRLLGGPDGYELRSFGGLVVEFGAPANAAGFDELLSALADARAEIVADVVFEGFDAESKRAQADLYSVSAQNYHLAARR